ncbi:hypothetical protein Sdia_47280 [Streptomyces diastaticus subsp. diastaticus]|uniref:Uncharacterized protein n=1 Tax=Streptomyces diastaticus subsp. diastaticus TaxID=68040 RepID=A0ABQ1CUH4_STRDI|nr:hypothetical protein Sdia_47280 [Streptomyces diastaticus subsp. diastaticus]
MPTPRWGRVPRAVARKAYSSPRRAPASAPALHHSTGHLLGQIAPLIDQVRSAGGVEPLDGVLRDWHARLAARGRAMLTGAAELEAYLRLRE